MPGSKPGWYSPAPTGSGLDEDVVSQQLKVTAQRLGLKLPRGQATHVLRHTHATLLLLAGEPLHVVSRPLGHSNEAFTAKTYAHVLPGQQASAVARFASIVDSVSGGAHGAAHKQEDRP